LIYNHKFFQETRIIFLTMINSRAIQERIYQNYSTSNGKIPTTPQRKPLLHWFNNRSPSGKSSWIGSNRNTKIPKRHTIIVASQKMRGPRPKKNPPSSNHTIYFSTCWPFQNFSRWFYCATYSPMFLLQV